MAEPMNGLHEQTVFISKDSVQECCYICILTCSPRVRSQISRFESPKQQPLGYLSCHLWPVRG
jgi:hypothetical protein